MRLTLDLRLEPRTAPQPDERLLQLGELADMVRRPRELAALLWRSRWDSVDVLVDSLPLSPVQAGAVGLAALARARRFNGGPRLPFLLKATLAFAVAFPREVIRTAVVARRARQAVASDFGLPRHVPNPSSVLYMRADPVLRWYGQLVGGASTHTTGVINGLVANGLDVEVFAAERPAWTESVPFTQVELERVHHLIFWFTMTDFGHSIAKAAADRRPDFVYQRYAMGSYAGLELAQKLRVPLVLEYNGSELWVQKHWGSGRTIQAEELAVGIEERNLRSASLVVVVSDVLKDQVVEQGVDPSRVLVNPNGVDVDRVAPFREHAPSHWRARAGLPEAPSVGFVGSFGLWHGVLVLPDMIEELATLVPEARWVLIGDGALQVEVREDIERRGLADRVHMPGIVPHEEALALLAASDVCVSPHVPNPDGTRFFGSPTKLFEYMGLAKPIVASDLEQLGEVIEDGETGVLTAPGDAAAAAREVARLLEDERERARLGAAALESARKTYSWEAHTRRILDALAG